MSINELRGKKKRYSESGKRNRRHSLHQLQIQQDKTGTLERERERKKLQKEKKITKRKIEKEKKLTTNQKAQQHKQCGNPKENCSLSADLKCPH